MCLAIPMCIVSIDDFSALCEARGQQRRVSLLPLFGESLAPGDWVQVHLDRAVQRMTAEDAAAAWEVFDLILAAQEPVGSTRSGAKPAATGHLRSH
jgi:hydrogenase expression/formation protein HypC